MSALLFVLGVLLIVVVIGDALWTTIMASGGGPWTSLVTRVVLATVTRVPGGRRRLMPLVGGIMLLKVVLTWIVLLWIGWWLLLCSDPDGVIHGQSMAPADAWDRLYFAGYAVFTLGIGDFVPNGHGWQIATVLASMSGFFMITLAVSYIIPVLSAAVQKRQLAAMIRDLGDGPDAMLTRYWDGEGFGGLLDTVNTSIWPLIQLHAERHAAYPVLHHFRGGSAAESLAVNLAALDEALMILDHGVPSEAAPPRSQTRLAREAIGNLLGMINRDFLDLAADPPPPPTRDALTRAGIPLTDDDDFLAAVHDHRERRRRLRGFVIDAGWEWADAVGEGGGHKGA